MERMKTGKKWSPNWLVFPALISGLIFYWFYNSSVQPQVPYMDSMLYITQVEKILRGEISWFDIYGSGEHRGLLFPFVLLVEWTFWGVDARVTTLLTGFVVVATLFYWVRSLVVVREDIFGQSYPVVKTIVVSIAAAIIVVSPAGFELWTLDLGFAQLIKNLFVVLFFYQLSILRLWEKSLAHALLFGVWGGFIILFVTYGWSYPFLAAVIFSFICIVISEPQTRFRSVGVLIPMILAQYIYVRLGQGVFSSEHASQDLAIFELVKGILYGAGSAFMGNEAMTKFGMPIIISMALGGLLLGCAGISLIRVLFAPAPVRIFAGALLVFSLTVLAGVTLARSSHYLNTGASRYFVDYVWLLLAPLLIISRSVDLPRLPSYVFWFNHFWLQKICDITRVLIFGLFFIAFLGHLRTWDIELNTAPDRAAIFSSMAELYREGIAEESDALVLQSPYDVAKKGVEIAQEYNLALLRNYGPPCHLSTASYTGDWYQAAQDGSRWMGKRAAIVLDKCKSQVVLKAYIPEYFSARELQINYDGQNRSYHLQPGTTLTETLQNSVNRRVHIQLSVDVTTNPSAQGWSGDGRDLGMLLTFIGN